MTYSISKLIDYIKNVKIQGASNIAKETIRSINSEIQKKNYTEAADVFFDYTKLKQKILNLRPTEPMLENGFSYIESHWPTSDNPTELKKDLNKVFNKFLKLQEKNSKKIISYNQGLIEQGDNVLTHCHSSLVERIIVSAKTKGTNFKVYNTETRPLYQGRITAKNLVSQKVKTTMIIDSAAGFLISRYSGDQLVINKVFLGADALFWDGSAVNKIGSYNIALAAYHEKIPVYIAAGLLKLDNDNNVKIELREKREVWPGSPKNLKIINPAFDVVPAKFITGIICEFGLIKPSQLRKLVRDYYPWIFKTNK